MCFVKELYPPSPPLPIPFPPPKHRGCLSGEMHDVPGIKHASKLVVFPLCLSDLTSISLTLAFPLPPSLTHSIHLHFLSFSFLSRRSSLFFFFISMSLLFCLSKAASPSCSLQVLCYQSLPTLLSPLLRYLILLLSLVCSSVPITAAFSLLSLLFQYFPLVLPSLFVFPLFPSSPPALKDPISSDLFFLSQHLPL